MRKIIKAVVILSSILAVPAGASEPTQINVEVSRSEGGWTAVYRLPRRSAWVFPHSAVDRANQRSWRLQSWRVLTPGVELVRLGDHDVLRSIRGPLPRQIRVSFQPFAASLIGDNDPALSLSDGTTALFTEQFDVLPAASSQQIEAAGEDIDKAAAGSARTTVEFVNRRGQVLLDGSSAERAVATDAETYAVFSDRRSATPETSFVDPQLPHWLRDQIRPLLRSLLDEYEGLFGPLGRPAPALIVQWSGPTPRVSGMGGSVVKDVIVMNFEGEGLLTESQRIKDRARLFLAHEAVHPWLGQKFRVADRSHRWITEGAADLIAIRTIARRDPTFDAEGRLRALVRECIEVLATQSFEAASRQRGDRVHYACGVVLALVAEAKSGGHFDHFIRTLTSGAGEERVITPQRWTEIVTRGNDQGDLRQRLNNFMTDDRSASSARVIGILQLVGVNSSILAERS